MNHAGHYSGAEVKPAALETPLGRTIDELGASLTDLAIASETLHKRLSGGVLRPDNVAAIAGNKPPEPVRAQMSVTAERIVAITERVRSLTTLMQNALDRLEA